MENYVEIFDKNKEQVSDISDKLSNIVLSNDENRDYAFRLRNDANYLIKKLNGKRIELCKPFVNDKKELKKEFDEHAKMIDSKKKEIETYAKSKLIVPLEKEVATISDRIINFDEQNPNDKAKGRIKTNYTATVNHTNLPPDYLIIKPDIKKIEKDLNSGELTLEAASEFGIDVEVKKELMEK